LQQAEEIYGGLDMLPHTPAPTPPSEVQHGARALHMEAGELMAGARQTIHEISIRRSHWLS
jgi:hypothetical protein